MTEVLACQRVARTATRMCHAVDLPGVVGSDAERARTPIGGHCAARSSKGPGLPVSRAI